MRAARRLLRRAGRLEAGAYLVEGRRHVADALRRGAEVRDLFLPPDASEDDDLAALARARGVCVARASERVLAALTDTATPQGVVAVVAAPPPGLGALPRVADLVVVLAGVRDPGNAGTLVRSSVAAGASAVVFARGSVDPLSPKVVRASAGHLNAVPVVREVELEECLTQLEDRGLRLVGADASGVGADAADLARPLALVLGNEAHGVPPEARPRLHELVSIPMPGPVDSLNVAVAGSILLFEVVRQRRSGAPPS